MDGENYSLSVTGRDVHRLLIDHVHQEMDLTVVENWVKGVVFPCSASTASGNILACASLNNQVLALDK